MRKLLANLASVVVSLLAIIVAIVILVRLKPTTGQLFLILGIAAVLTILFLLFSRLFLE